MRPQLAIIAAQSNQGWVGVPTALPEAAEGAFFDGLGGSGRGRNRRGLNKTESAGPRWQHKRRIDFAMSDLRKNYNRRGDWGIIMLCKTTWATLGVAAFVLAACDTFDDSGPSPEVRAYNTCQATYAAKHASLAKRWAVISGMNDDGSSGCYTGHGYPTSGDAVRATVTSCQKEYAYCWIFASSDGLSNWVKRIAANLAAGRDPDWRPSDDTASNGGDDGGGSDGGGNSGNGGGSSFSDFVGGFTDFLNAATGVVQATRGGGGGGGGGSLSLPGGNGASQRGAFEDCAKLFDALGPAGAAQKAECERRATNMGTAR